MSSLILMAPRGLSSANLTYTRRGGRPQQLDLALPAGRAPEGGWPVVLAFPGGGWRQASRKLLGPEVASFREFGYAVATVDVAYANSRPGTKVCPLNFDQARDAVRWVRANAARYGVDPDRIVAFGESAGAHLALLLGTQPDDPTDASVSTRVQAVVDLYGPVDLAPLFRQPRARDKLLTLLGGPPDRFPERYAAASPLAYVSGRTPPVFIAQGTADATIPEDQSIRLARALDRAGVANRLVLLPGYGHGFQPRRNGLDLIPEIVAFLDAVLPGRMIAP